MTGGPELFRGPFVNVQVWTCSPAPNRTLVAEASSQTSLPVGGRTQTELHLSTHGLVQLRDGRTETAEGF